MLTICYSEALKPGCDPKHLDSKGNEESSVVRACVEAAMDDPSERLGTAEDATAELS